MLLNFVDSFLEIMRETTFSVGADLISHQSQDFLVAGVLHSFGAFVGFVNGFPEGFNGLGIDGGILEALEDYVPFARLWRTR